MSLTRFANRDVLWSFIVIPHIRPCRFFYCPDDTGSHGSFDESFGGKSTRSRMFRHALRPSFPAGDSEAGSVCLLPEPPGRHLVDCRANAYAKSRPCWAKSRRIKGSGDADVPRHGARCAKCFKIDLSARAGVASLNAGRRAVQRIEYFFSGLSRRSEDARSCRDWHGAEPVKMTECFKAETLKPAPLIFHT